MRIGLQTWGTEGDIAPFVVLAEGLQRAGHQVTLVHTSLDDGEHPRRLAGTGVVVHRVGGPFGRSVDPYALTTSASPTWQLRALLARFHEPIAAELLEAGEALCRDNDIVVGHMLSRTLHTAALVNDTPRVSVAFSPQAIPGVLPPLGRSLGAWADAALWRLGDAVMTRTLYPVSERLQRQRGLPAFGSLLTEGFRSPVLNLVAASPALIPVLEAPATVVTGAWTPSASLQEPALEEEVAAFLRAGSPPVHLTFGSCTTYAARDAWSLMKGAVERAGVRAIVQVDPALGRVNGHTDLLVLHRAPHAALFPRCAAVVHHGGAGTTHAVARAGAPSVVVPHGFDQPWWARRLHALGVAPRPLPRRSATADLLAGRIREVLNTASYTRTAGQLRSRMDDERGVAAAVDAIGRLARG
ncbi:MAG: glycosyltransferase family 1 protein [Flavobacteriales bacterium]|nr:glycosyltransferase family 1 protein [Flavobacteriales bacterium]